MERYVNQLIEDLQLIASNMKPPHGLLGEANEDMSYVDDYLYGERFPISEITRIASEQLPPAEKLTLEQQALLAVELENFLTYFHFYLDFPHGYPDHLRYPFIRGIWEEEHVPMMIGETHIEFCEYEEKKCPFPGYCKVCDDVIEMEKSMESLKSNDEMEEFDLFGENDESPYVEDISDLYDGNGNKIDKNTIPIPPLCTICRSYQIKDWDENLLCLMNRHEQLNEKSFECGAFEPL